VSRRLRRLVLLLVPVLLLALAGCGSSSSSSSAATSTDPLDAVSITGAVGTKPQVEWKTKFTANDVQTTTLTKGDGDTIAEGDQVQAQIWIGNGFSQKEAYSTYDQGGAQTLTLNGQLSPVFADAIKGAAVGSRIVVTAPADELVGEGGNADLGISNKDPLLVVIDLLGKPKPPLDGPQGKPQPSPAWAPKLVTKGDFLTPTCPRCFIKMTSVVPPPRARALSPCLASISTASDKERGRKRSKDRIVMTDKFAPNLLDRDKSSYLA